MARARRKRAPAAAPKRRRRRRKKREPLTPEQKDLRAWGGDWKGSNSPNRPGPRSVAPPTTVVVHGKRVRTRRMSWASYESGPHQGYIERRFDVYQYKPGGKSVYMGEHTVGDPLPADYYPAGHPKLFEYLNESKPAKKTAKRRTKRKTKKTTARSRSRGK